MAGWGARLLSFNDSQSKDTKSEGQPVSSTGGGGITSFISGLLWSGDDTSVDSNSHEPQRRDSGKEYRQSTFQEPKDTLDKSWEDVDMAELKPKVN